MNSSTRSAFLFPGQGAYQPGALALAARLHGPAIEDTLREVDSVSRAHFNTSVRDMLLDQGAPSLSRLLERDPDTLQLAIYAAAVATYQLLEAQTGRPSILIGHSFGEIAALVCGGAFSVHDGAQIAAQRSLALRSAAGSGYMAALGAPAQRCAAIIGALVAPDLSIAVENGPSQTVISGPTAAMDRMAAVAQALGLSFIRLAAPYPFHNAQLEQAAQTFHAAVAGVRRQPLRVPVYSPILQRNYNDDEDLAKALASHLTRPVHFADAIRRPVNVWSQGKIAFVEMGASNALIKLVRQILGDPSIAAFAPFAPDTTADAFEATVQALRTTTAARVTTPTSALSIPLAHACNESEAAQFWQTHGTLILAQVNEQFAQFQRNLMSPVTAVQAPASRDHAFNRVQLQRRIVALFAETMEYPPEVFTDDVALEAELGIDSVKQMELLGRLELEYRLPPRPEDFRLSDYGTLRQITDFVFAALGSAPPAYQVAADERRQSDEPDAAHASMQATPSAATSPAKASRAELQQQIVALFAEAMEYPPEVFTDDVALEAELGIDSVTQMELLGKLEQQYHLPARPEDFRLSEYGTLRKITDLVYAAVGGDQPDAMHAHAPVALIEATPLSARRRPASASQAVKPTKLSRAALQEQIVALFAQAMEYPPEVFTDDVELEAELGIDSVKQMELLGKLELEYRLPPRPEDFRLSDYGTLRKITDFIYQTLAVEPTRERDPLYAVG